ncbi:S41 family peptidase [Bacillus sp. FJAT-45350]|uniref:S41 family peptidase n=1 Tax=Bacillus sp. FJAT-45350 TaxID=2011014 RepID=UPI000BB88612|nr:S41 family peptidase [Bacillus sp. FJAT-45350]
MRKLRNLVVGSISLLLVGCSSNPPLNDDALISLELVAEHNRFYTEHSFDELPDPRYDFLMNDEDELSEEMIQNLRITNSNTDSSFTKKQLIEDVEVFHLAMKYMYALYEYMGGDKAFQDARDGLIDHLRELEDGVQLSSIQFSNLLRSHYDFISDTHLQINHSPMESNDYSFFVSEHFRFNKDTSGEFWLIGREAVKLASINGDEEVSSYLKPSLNDNGEIVYIPGAFSSYLTDSERVWEIVFQEGDGAQIETIRLRPEAKALPNFRLGDRLSLSEKEGVPWFQLRTMFAFEGAPVDYYDIIDSAKHLSREPYFVLDVRGNEGGSVILVEKWLEEFFGEPISWSSQSNHLFSKTNLALVTDTIDYLKEQGVASQTFEDDFTDLFRVEKFDSLEEPYWEVEEKPFKTVKDNDTHIFILIDNNTASAAEHLVAQLKQANNTTVIGMNTKGAIISGNALIWQLPHTNVAMSVPTYFNYNPDLLEKEAVGIQPDIWVHPEKAEQRILTFIKENTKR